MATCSSTTHLLKTLTLSSVTSHRLCLPLSAAAKSPFLSLSLAPPPSATLRFSAGDSKSSRSLVALVAQTDFVADDDVTGDWESGVDAGESEGERGEIGEPSFSEPPEDAKIYVGNMPFDVDSQRLAMLFEKAGIVEMAEVIYNRETDRSRGFGFVTMSTVEEAEKAVEMYNRYDLDGRMLTVNKASAKGERAERPPRSFEPSFKIYVGNLPWDTDNARLEGLFSEHGKVVEARVLFDRETGRSRGFGFVTMASEAEMEEAIAALDGQSMDGRAIRVNVAMERPRRNF